MTNLLLIDSRVSDIDAILSSLTSDTKYIVFNYTNDTFDTLKTKISNTLTQYTHIAIAQHKYGISTYSMVESMPPGLLYEYVDGAQVSVSEIEPQLESWQSFIDFINWLKTNLGMQYLDLLACDLWSDLNWVYVIETLKQQCGIAIRASIDITGYGGDFILESDNVNLIGLYFTEKIMEYKYSFVGNDFITLINTKSPWGVYSASKYSTLTNTLYELRNNGRNATVSGTLTAGNASGNGATAPIQFLNGTTTTNITWPAGSIPATHTVAFITRYTNASSNQRRVLSGNDYNILFGHHTSKRGVVYISSGWTTTETTKGTITNWVNMVAKTGGTTPNNVLLDTNAIGTATIASSPSGTMVINNHTAYGAEYSDFGFSYLMIWDQALTDAEMVIVSNQLELYLDTGNAPPVLTAFETILNNKRPWGIYRAVDWVSGTNTLPEARGITARNATKGGAGAVTYTASTTGNGANANITAITGGTTTEMIWPAGSIPTTYTMAFITRMTSANGRIFQAGSNNLLFGHWSNYRGVYYDKNQWINITNYGTLSNWLPMVCKVGASPNNCIVDGVSRGGATSTALSSADQLYINNGAYGTEDSSWELAYLMIWDQALTDTEAAVVSNEMMSYLGTGALPETYGYVLNGYFTSPTVSTNTATEYTSPYSAITNWTVTTSGAPASKVYVFNQNASGWNFISLAGVTQVFVSYYTNTGSLNMTQSIYFTPATYELSYYTMAGLNPNLVSLTASIYDASHTSLITSSTDWNLRKLYFTIPVASTQTLRFATSYTSTGVETSAYLTAINISPYTGVLNGYFTTPALSTNSWTSYTSSLSSITYWTITNSNAYIYIVNTSSVWGYATPLPTDVSQWLAIQYQGTAGSTTMTQSIYFGDTGSYTLTYYTHSRPSFTNNIITLGASIAGSSQSSLVSSNTAWELRTLNFTVSSAGSQTLTFTTSFSGGSSDCSIFLTAIEIQPVVSLVLTAPGTPTLNSVTAGNQQLTVAFTAPASNGGSAITTYKYSLNSGALVSASTTTSPFTISGLAINTSYSVYIVATNAIGDSSNSSVVSATTWNYPGAPTISTVTGGNKQISIAFSAPASNGGTAITTYKYSLDGGAFIDAFTTSSPIIVSSLSDNTTYSVILRATNPVGDSSNSNAVSGTTWTVPDAPTITSITEGNQQLSVAFTPPASNGGSAITTYKYSLDGGAFVNASTTTSPIVITGLTGGTSYSVVLRSTTVVGDSTSSNSLSGTPYSIPAKPTIVIQPGSYSIVVTSVSGSNGGRPITSYKYSTDGVTYSDTGSAILPFSINNLTPGDGYYVTVKSTNAAGDSTASDSVYGLAGTIPDPPTITSVVSGASQTLYVYYDDPENYGYSSITDIKYSLNGGAFTSYGSDPNPNPLILTGLTNGTTYIVKLKATNVVGDSGESNAATETLSIIPHPPTLSLATPGNEQIVLTFSAPIFTGYSSILYYMYSLNSGADVSLNTLSSPFTITGLTNGTQYSVKMKSVNRIGSSAYSSTLTTTPRTTPSAPTITGFTTLPKSVLVAFTNGNNGGNAISNTKYSLNGQEYVAGDVSSSPLLISNLTEGISYTISLKSTNDAGDSGESDVSSVYLPYTYNYEKPLSIDSNGEIFVMTLRNELNGNIQYKYSYDGSNWTSQSLPTGALTSYNPYNVKWTGNQFLISGNVSSGGTNALLKSYDGIDFSISKTTTTNQIFDLETNLEYRNTITFPINTTLIVGGVSNDTVKIAYSYDAGSTWLPSTNSNSVFPVSANDAVWNGKIWIAVGEGLQPIQDSITLEWTISQQTGNTIATSEDGKTWIGRGKHMFSIRGNAVDWSRQSNLIVAVGDGSQNSIAYSHDGVYWLGCGKSCFETGNCIKWNGQIWVAGGNVATVTQKSLAYSFDGKIWEQPVQSDLFQTSTNTIWWDGTQWVAYGTDPSYNVATSSNGTTWTMINDASYASPTPFTNQTQYLKIENNQVLESPDGTFWGTPQSVTNMSVLKQFAWNRSNEGVPFIQPISLAFGEGANTIGYSYDGVYWTGLGKSVFTTRGNNGVWNGKIWVAVGTGTYWCAYSYDGLFWEGVNDNRFTEAYDIAWNGYVFVAVGEGNTCIAISANGINWSSIPNSTAIFTQKSTAIKWTGNAWIAYGSGGNTTATSTEIYATVWSPSSTKNMAVTDLSSVVLLAYGPNVTSAPPYSSLAASYDIYEHEAYRVIDDDMTTYFSTSAIYSSYTGLSTTGTEFFFNNAPGSITGEFIIFDATQLLTIKSYLLSFRLTSSPQESKDVLREWALVAFSGDDTWENLFIDTNVDLIHRGYINTIPSTYDNLCVQYVDLFENTSQYRIYILVFVKSFETDVGITRFDMFYESDTTTSISKYMKPVVTRNSVLHPNTLMPYYHTVYLMADLSNNIIQNNQVNSPPFLVSDYGINTQYYTKTINSAFYGTNNQIITSSGYDGNRFFITTLDGKLIYMSNEQANTYANFDTSFNNTIITTNLPTIYTSCYNRNFILLGGTGNSVITYNTMDANITSWYSTNANEIFTSVYGLASNPGYGHVYIPNALYLNTGDKLSVVTPKTINQTTTNNTAITIDLNKPYL